MTFASVLALLPGIFKFWTQVTWLIETLQKTPEEQQQDLMVSIQKQADAYQATGRPKWGA